MTSEASGNESVWSSFSSCVFTSCVTEPNNGRLLFTRNIQFLTVFRAFVSRFKLHSAVVNVEISTNVAWEVRRVISTSAKASARPAGPSRAWNAVKSHLTRALREGERVRGSGGWEGEGSGGSGGSFERIRGRGKTRLRDRAPLLQRQQDVSRSPLTHDLSDVTTHCPRPSAAAYCTLREVCTAHCCCGTNTDASPTTGSFS